MMTRINTVNTARTHADRLDRLLGRVNQFLNSSIGLPRKFQTPLLGALLFLFLNYELAPASAAVPFSVAADAIANAYTTFSAGVGVTQFDGGVVAALQFGPWILIAFAVFAMIFEIKNAIESYKREEFNAALGHGAVMVVIIMMVLGTDLVVKVLVGA
jgi:hypothetical protein